MKANGLMGLFPLLDSTDNEAKESTGDNICCSLLKCSNYKGQELKWIEKQVTLVESEPTTFEPTRCEGCAFGPH